MFWCRLSLPLSVCASRGGQVANRLTGLGPLRRSTLGHCRSGERLQGGQAHSLSRTHVASGFGACFARAHGGSGSDLLALRASLASAVGFWTRGQWYGANNRGRPARGWRELHARPAALGWRFLMRPHVIARLFVLVGSSLGAWACGEPLRVGEHVLIEYEDAVYPAFVKEKRGATRLLVHFEGCDVTWVREVSVDRVKGRLADDEVEHPYPRRYACTPKQPTAEARAANSPYKVGDRVRVKWRGSNYPATVVGVVAADRYLVHYDGHESAWDETVHIDRIAGAR